MSISSFTTVMMLDSRPSRITISVPTSTDIMNRIITFKDLYGSASNSTIVLVTRSGDTFEDGTFSTIMSNAYQTVNLYAGQPGKWLNVGATGGGGDSANFTTVSNRLNGVSTNVTTISTNLDTLSNRLNGVSTNVTTISTNLDTLSNRLNGVSTNVTTISTNLNTVSNTVAAGRFTGISTNTISTNLVAAAYISSPQGYISSLIVDSLAFSLSNSFIVMGDIITTSVSTIQTFTSSLTTNNLKVGTVSSLNYIAFSGLQQGYAQTVIAEQATAAGIQELLVFKGSTNTDRIRMQTTGPIVFEPGVSARVFPNTGSNATPAMIINTSSNVGIGIAAPTVSLDVAGAGRFTAVSTQTISTNIVNAGYLVGLLPGNTADTSVSPLAITNGAAYLSFSPQIEFQYYTGGFKHFMGSRHYGGVTNHLGNAIDFWLYSATGGSNASTTPGTCNVNTMSVTAAGVGINQNSPSVALDVAGAGKFTSNLTIFGAGFATNAATWTNGTTHTLYGDSTAASTKYIQWAYNNTPGTTIADGANMNIACPYVGINQSAPTVALDVAGAGRFTAVSTQTISTNQLNSSNICNVGWFSNVGNLSNGGSAYFFSNGSSAASPSTTNVFPYATFKINSASTNTLSPVVPLLLTTGGYGGSIAGGLTQSVGPILSLGTVDGGLPSTIEGYRLTGSNSAFYGKVDMQRNKISNVSSIYGCGNTLQIYNSTDINVLCGGNLYMYTNPGQYNGIYNGTSYVQIDPSQNINISSAGNIALNGNTYTYSKPILIKNDTNHGLVYGDGTFRNIATDGPFLFGYSAGALGITDGGNSIKLNWDRTTVNINTSTINLRGTANSAVRIGPSQYQGTAADTTTYGLERSRHELRFAGYRDAQIDKIGSKIVNINKQTYGNSGLRQLIQSADLAFFTVPPDTADIDNTVERMRITDGGNVGIGVTAPTVSLDVAGAGRFTTVSTNAISTASITAGGTINITSPLTNCTGEIYASGGAIRIVGSSTTFDLWNYCSLTQVSGNLTINSYSNVTTTASSNININATSTIYISSGGNAINLSGNIDINNKNISNVNITRTAALSTNTISTATLNVAGAPISGRLIISTINPQTDPAFIIIKNPNISYFYADYTNLTNYITISNYGAVSGDYINIVNTGNSGTPATFQVLDGSTGASTIIRYIYPGHAGVVAYSAGQWWPL